MSTFTTPVTDRSQTDLDTDTDKAFLNWEDWMRIYDNAKASRNLVQDVKGVSITFDTVEQMGVYSFPTVAELNLILANIERTRQAAALPDDPELVDVNVGWEGGVENDAPNIEDVNSWERVLELIESGIKAYANAHGYVWLPNSATPQLRVRCGDSHCGSDIILQNFFRTY